MSLWSVRGFDKGCKEVCIKHHKERALMGDIKIRSLQDILKTHAYRQKDVRLEIKTRT